MRFKKITFVIIFVSLVLAALLRPVNLDEPYYTVCASLVFNGEFPYKNFFFHHMPLMPFVYAPVSVEGSWSLILGRVLSILFLFSAGLLLFKYLYKKGAESKYLFLFLLLFYCNSYLVDWLSIIRVYALSTFLFVASVLSVDRLFSTRNIKMSVFSCSILFSFLALSKIVFAAHLILFIIYVIIFYRKTPGIEHKGFWLSLFAGISIPFLLFLLVFGDSLDIFYDSVFTANFLMKSELQSPIFPHLYKPFLFLIFPQNIILLAIIFFSGFKYSLFEKFILLNLVIYFILHLFTLLLLEYAVSMIPFLVLLAVLRFEKFSNNINVYVKRLKGSSVVFRLVLLLYLLSFPFSLPHVRYFLEGKFISPNVFQLNNIVKVINSVPGITAITSWEGYTIYSNKSTLLRDNYISNFFDIRVDEKTKLKYRITFPGDYKKLIDNRIPDIIIYDEHDPAHLLDLKESIVYNYSLLVSLENILIYAKHDLRNKEPEN